MPKFVPKIVFIDTEQFDGKGLSFSNSTFARLADLVKAGHAKVLLTEVVVGEVRRHIQQRFKEARKKLGQQFGGLFTNLTVTPKPPVFSDDFWTAAEAEVMDAFTSYCKGVKAQVLPLSAELVKPVFDWYFAYEAPFNTEKRKDEFPDAFSIASVNEWAQKESKTVYIVSNDAAFKVVSQQPNTPLLIHLSSLAEFFGLFPDPALAASIKQALVEFFEDDDNLQFGQEEFEKLDFYVEDAANLEVENVYVLYTDPDKLHVVEADKGRAIVVGEAYVTFMANIPGIRDEIEESAYVTTEIEIAYDVSDPTKIDVLSVKYEKAWAIGVSLPSSYKIED